MGLKLLSRSLEYLVYGVVLTGLFIGSALFYVIVSIPEYLIERLRPPSQP